MNVGDQPKNTPRSPSFAKIERHAEMFDVYILGST
jgi:hypothetical protein